MLHDCVPVSAVGGVMADGTAERCRRGHRHRADERDGRKSDQRPTTTAATPNLGLSGQRRPFTVGNEAELGGSGGKDVAGDVRVVVFERTGCRGQVDRERGPNLAHGAEQVDDRLVVRATPPHSAA